jgi:hypothetical protein
MPQCKCKTNDGSRCKNSANPDSSHQYCTQHDMHDKMRCVSLARKNIGYHKTRPVFPRKYPRGSPRPYSSYSSSYPSYPSLSSMSSMRTMPSMSSMPSMPPKPTVTVMPPKPLALMPPPMPLALIPPPSAASLESTPSPSPSITPEEVLKGLQKYVKDCDLSDLISFIEDDMKDKESFNKKYKKAAVMFHPDRIGVLPEAKRNCAAELMSYLNRNRDSLGWRWQKSRKSMKKSARKMKKSARKMKKSARKTKKSNRRSSRK